MRLLALALTLPLTAQSDALRGAPLHYDRPASAGPVERLVRAVASGGVELELDAQAGFLPAILEALEIDLSSQVLVFSKTSFQNDRISPRTPRSVYFGDEAYVGSIPGAPIIELTSMDPKQGPTFYTLERGPDDEPVITRRYDECLTCHASTRTYEWPGNLVRSVHPDQDGNPILRSGTSLVHHETPFEERWGGWYVTGTHGEARHRGNALASDASGMVDVEEGANIESLERFFPTERYLSPHSDIVALMVLEHQAEMHNRLARAGYEVRLALHRQEEMNGYFGDPPGTLRDATRRILKDQARKLVSYVLFEKEAKLAAPVRGTSSFARDFQAKGRRDSKGRSLRELDLEERLFRYPCSFVLHSPMFAGLPRELRDEVWAALDEALESAKHLGAARRKAIREILSETAEGLPEGWGS